MKRLSLRLSAGASVCAIVLVGCSTEVAQFQPVAGDAAVSIRYAANDVLREQGIRVMVWPQCTFSDATYTCPGTTTDGKPILATAQEGDPIVMVLKVDNKTVFTGVPQDVLNREGRTR